MAHEGPSSSSFNHGWNYDVFVSFNGRDTRYSFSDHLRHALKQKGIHSFRDDVKIRKGESISPSILKAIEESRISIIVFSKNYASSSWCLDELVKIIGCMKETRQLVRPVFYYVDPSNVRHQRGSYGRSMAEHEAKLNNSNKGKPEHEWGLALERLHSWRVALSEAANLSGWHFKYGYESKLIQKITEEISSILNPTVLHIADHPVGLKNRIQEVMSLLSRRDALMVGIHGIRGIGKTTIARAVYNSIAKQFEASCFLADVRENSMKNGLVQLQETLLLNLLGENNIKLGNVSQGIPILENRLRRKKVLLILDDVDNLKQVRALAGRQDWFGSGSRIIITTRNKHLLTLHGVEKLYEVKELNDDESLELFSWNAFRKREPNPSYVEIAKSVVQYAKGLPLALNVVGSDLFGKTIEEWESALKKYERIPSKGILDVLKVSYDNLDYSEREQSLTDNNRNDGEEDDDGNSKNLKNFTLILSLFFLTLTVLLLAVQKFEKNLTLINLNDRDFMTRIPDVSNYIEGLPFKTDLFQNIEEHNVGGCPQFPKLPKKILMVDRTDWTPKLNRPVLKNFDLFDEDHELILSSFLKSKWLVPSNNYFVTILECFGDLRNLLFLHVDNCKQLRYASVLPPYLQYIDARNCTSLTPNSSDVIRSQAFIEVEYTDNIVVLRKKIPNWFNHWSKGGSLAFCVCRKFPGITVCFTSEFNLLINGVQVIQAERSLPIDHVWQFDQRIHLTAKKWHNPNEHLHRGWIANLVQGSTSSAYISTNRGIPINDSSNIKNPKMIGLTNSKWNLKAQAKSNTEAEKSHIQIPKLRTNQQLEEKEIKDSQISMEAFYASLEAETANLSDSQNTQINTRQSEGTQKALQILRDFVSKKFALSLQPKQSKLMKDTLQYLLCLTPEDGISLRMRSVIFQISKSFTQWGLDYNDARFKLESANDEISKVEVLNERLEANVRELREVEELEKGIWKQLDSLEERKKELEKEIIAVKAEIADFRAAREDVAKRKIEVFEKGRMLKAQRDDLRNRMPRLRADKEWAKICQANIEQEWSKLGQQFIQSSSFEDLS